LTAVLVEAAVETLDAALAAEAAGAGRLELCANLDADGLTPDWATLASIVARARVPLFAIVRPRPGTFVYDDREIAVMLRDIRAAADAGVSGIVTGALGADGGVDLSLTRALVEAGGGLPVTFHRAFDRAIDKRRVLETLIEAGIRRVLTSGGALTALDGGATIAELVRAAAGRIAIVAGGGIRAHNVAAVIARTGVREVHSRFIDRAGMEQLVSAVRTACS
jgi:copper homeostasis protein